MNKIIKAQAGVAVKAIPVRNYPAINIGELVSNLAKKGAEVGSKAMSIGLRIGKGASKVLSGPFGILALALNGDIDAPQPYSEGERMRESYRLAKNVKYTGPVSKNKPQEKPNFQSKTRAIPVAGQSSTATPVMAKKKKKRVAVGQKQETPRDTVRVTNGAAVENATPQDTVKTQHENTEQTADDRNILQRLGDRWARRKAKNNKPKTENPPTNPPQENKGLVKRGFGYIKEHPIKSTLIGGPVVFLIGPKPAIKAWDVTSGIIKNRAKAWSFEEDEDKNKTRNIDANKSTEPVQNDTTQAYNGFLINQQNLVE